MILTPEDLKKIALDKMGFAALDKEEVELAYELIQAGAKAILEKLGSAPMPEPFALRMLLDLMATPAILMQTEDGHEFACIKPQAWADIQKLPPKMRAAISDQLQQAYLQGAAAQLSAEPAFWVRYSVGAPGLYEGPLHNSQIEDVRKESGAWTPLYTLKDKQ